MPAVNAHIPPETLCRFVTYASGQTRHEFTFSESIESAEAVFEFGGGQTLLAIERAEKIG
jgi:hypothetical protein